jgi:hypothetical protein
VALLKNFAQQRMAQSENQTAPQFDFGHTLPASLKTRKIAESLFNKIP